MVDGESSGYKGGVKLIAEERQRQVVEEGCSLESDREYVEGELRDAALSYLYGVGPGIWPWTDRSYKPTNRIRDLTKAGALIAAELDRLLYEEQQNPTDDVIKRIRNLTAYAVPSGYVDGPAGSTEVVPMVSKAALMEALRDKE